MTSVFLCTQGHIEHGEKVSQNGEIFCLTHINRFIHVPDILQCAAEGLTRTASSAAKVHQTELANAEAV